MFGSLLGVDAAAWGVIVAVAALLLSASGSRGSKESARRAERSASAAERAAAAAERAVIASERSAAAVTASAKASERSAAASETSAVHADRSAGAAERSASAHERSLELEEERVTHQRRERTDRDAPRFEAKDETESARWKSTSTVLFGLLRNAGNVTALITGVAVDLPTGGRVAGRYRLEPPGPADGGFSSNLHVPPGRTFLAEFETNDGSIGAALGVDGRPRVRVACSSPDLGWEGERQVELLKKGGDGLSTSWQVRPVA